MSVSWCCVGCLSCAFWQPCNDIHASRWIFFVHLVCWFTKNIVSQIRCAARRDNMCMLSSSEKIRWRASLGSFHRNEFLRRVVIRYRIPSFTCNTKYNCICFASDVLASPILHPRRIFLLGGVSFNNFNLGNKEWFFSRHVSRASRFNMITLNIILSDLLRRSKNPYWFLRHLLFLQVETLPYHHDILRWGSLSLRWIPVSEWVLGIRSLFLLILLSHLPQEISILHLFWVIRTHFALSLLGYVSDASNFSNSSISAVRIYSSQILVANRACPGRIPQIFVHFQISRLPGGLGHFVESNSIS